MVEPIALYRTRVRHHRSGPVQHAFEYRSYWWLVDVDDLDALPRHTGFLMNIRPRDYCGNAGESIAANIRAFLAENGCEAAQLSILLLTTPRQFGYAFNPITVFYCLRDDGAVAAVIAEVHNTYGGRHRYFLSPDSRDWSQTRKHLYVSPFFDLSGVYRIHSPVPDSSLRLTVELHRDGALPFQASVSGQRIPIRISTITAALVLGSPLLTAARIRIQGTGLWRKGLKVYPRNRQKVTCDADS